MTGTSELLRRWPPPTALSVGVWFESLAKYGQLCLKSIDEADKELWVDLSRDLQSSFRPEVSTRDLRNTRYGCKPHISGQFGKNNCSCLRQLRSLLCQGRGCHGRSQHWLMRSVYLQAFNLTGTLFRHHRYREKSLGTPSSSGVYLLCQ